MPALEEIRRITIESRVVGADQSTTALQRLAAAQTGVAVASEKVAPAVLSADAALNKLRLSIDAEFRSTERLAVAQRTLATARQQGLVSLAEENRLMDLANAKYAAGAVNTRGFAGALGGVKGLLGGLGIGLGLGELMKLPDEISAIVKEAGGLTHMAETIGITTKQLQELQYAGKQVDVTTQDMTAALRKFSTNLGEASRGGGDLFDILKANHVTISGDVTKDFLAVANLIQNATNAEQRNVIVTKAFGKSAQEMGLLFEDGAAGVSRLLDEADRSGAILGGPALQAAKDMDAELTKMKAAWDTAFTSFVISIAPAVVSALQGIGNQIATITFAINSLKAGNLKDALGITFGKGFGPNAGQEYAARQLKAGILKPETPNAANRATEDFYNAFGGTFASPLDVRVGTTKLPPAPGGGGGEKKMQAAIDAIEKQTVALNAQAVSLNMTAGAAAEYQKRQELLNVATENHIKLSPAELANIDKTAAAYGKATSALEHMKDAQDAQKFLAQSLFDAVKGATSLSDAFQKLASSITDALLQATLLGSGPLAGLFGTTKSQSGGIFGALFSGLFGGGSRGGVTMGGLYHAGGIVGSTQVPMRPTHPAYFDDAPRLHSGLSADEFPAILQRGEAVIPRGGSSGTVVQIIDQRTSGGSIKQERTTGPDGRTMIRALIQDELGSGRADKALQSRYGMRPRKVAGG